MADEYYEYMYEMFMLYWGPVYKDQIESWRPSGGNSLYVNLTNGRTVEFYISDNSIRLIPEKIETDEEYKREFMFRLKKQMDTRAFNQQDLAEATGFTQATISSYLNCKSMPSLFKARQLAKALKCSIEDLCGF